MGTYSLSLLLLLISLAPLTSPSAVPSISHHRPRPHKHKHSHNHHCSIREGKRVRQRNAALLQLVGGGYSLSPPAPMPQQQPHGEVSLGGEQLEHGYSSAQDFFIRTGLKPAGPSSFAYQQPDGSYLLTLRPPSSSSITSSSFNSYAGSANRPPASAPMAGSGAQFSENGINAGEPSPPACETPAQSNCVDRRGDCPELEKQGECERKPGMMLRMCRRSCCNCDDSKCFDSQDEPKWMTLCLAQTHHSTSVVLSACDMPETRSNAIDYCPKTCGVCTAAPNHSGGGGGVAAMHDYLL